MIVGNAKFLEKENVQALHEAKVALIKHFSAMPEPIFMAFVDFLDKPDMEILKTMGTHKHIRAAIIDMAKYAMMHITEEAAKQRAAEGN